MDPSYNNSFDSFQNASGGVISSAPSASEGRKLRKGPIIVGVVFVVIVLVALVWYVISGGVSPLSDVETKAAKKDPEFGEMMKYIVSGEGFTIEYPTNENGEAVATTRNDGYNFFYAEADEEEAEEDAVEDEFDDEAGETIDYKYDFVYAIDIYGENYGWVESYYGELENKTKKFEETLDGRVSEGTLNGYKETMKVLRNAVDYATVEYDLITVAVRDGVEAARNYIDSQIRCGDNAELGEICAAEAEYYESVVNLYEKYDGQGCAIVDGDEVTYDDECMMVVLGEEGYNLKMEEILEIDMNTQKFLDYDSLKAIDEAVRAHLKQMAEEIVNA